MNIEGKIALVTGANRGIGKVILESLLAGGVSKVYAAVRSIESAQSLVDRHGDKVVPIELDLNKPGTIRRAAEVAADVEIVVNNAGILKTATSISDHAVEVLREEFEVNVFGLIRVAKAFAPVLKANGGGAFVQLNSVASLKNFADFSTYSASKAAAYSITQGLKDTLKEQDTLVVSVHPGPIPTEMASAAGLGEIAEPPSLVADSIIDALQKEQFHAFPDSMAKQMQEAYAGFATNVIEADASGG